MRLARIGAEFSQFGVVPCGAFQFTRKLKRMKIKSLFALVLALSLAIPTSHSADAVTLTVQADKPGASINPDMWGVFFEDINLGADGGLYAELVKNRSFEFPTALMGWTRVAGPGGAGEIEVRSESPRFQNNPNYVRIAAANRAAFGLANEGFRGIGVKQGDRYDFAVQARAGQGKPTLRVELVRADGTVLARKKVRLAATQWTAVRMTLTARYTEAKAQLHVVVEGGGTVDLDHVSLFPQKTWKQRPGGLRADMVQKLADLQPGFLRFPGGCIVEGNVLSNRYQWKNTLGPVAERKLLINRWNFEFKHRPTPDYFQTFGLGFFEYFQLCEDIGAEPMPILSCGLACQFNSGEACTPEELSQFIQDAVDLIEFANGPVTSPWGRIRAEMGHPAPFNLKMIGIGNENWDQPYIERYAKFHAVLKAKHPEIQLISSAGPQPNDKRFHYAWGELRKLNADIVDEHCYDKPAWFYAAATRYDNYDRKGPKVFFGEYAAQSDKTVSVLNRNNLECALAEAACMTGMERNADVVRMASYAPLFAHEEGWQWRPNLIWLDNLNIYGTPNYYVQQMFARNRGGVVLPVELKSKAGKLHFASATRDEATGEVIVKIVNGEAEPAAVQLELVGAGKIPARAQVQVLAGSAKTNENSLLEPDKIAPHKTVQAISRNNFLHHVPAYSVTVLRVQ
jgi:alpha-N-arabinofuranosidase